MREELPFEVDAAIITRLGRELMAKQETALIELIKNGFDADATEVTVAFEGSDPSDALEVRDNGSGMTRSELIGGFMRLASDLKVQSPTSPGFGRQRAGRKGVGRFATQRLGDRLVLTTCTEESSTALRLTVNWDQFVGGRRLDEVTVGLEEISPHAEGTVIRVERLRDTWSEAQIRRCWRGVSALLQPFPVAPIQDRTCTDPGFQVRFVQSGQLFRDESVVADMQTEILDHLHAVIEMQVDERGRAQWRMSKNVFGPTRDWTPIHHSQGESLRPPPYVHLRNAAMKAYYVIILSGHLPGLVYTRIRDVLADDGGIRLYRNGFRVIPYGDRGNDWLRLDEQYGRRSIFAPIANRNFFGVVEVHDPEGTIFEEHTSREGLIETPSFLELQDLVSSILINAAQQIARDRGRKPSSGQPAQPLASRETPRLDDVRDLVRRVIRVTRDLATTVGGPDAESAAQLSIMALNALNTKQGDIDAARNQQADEAEMLRFLATLGMTTAEFAHETGMTFEAFRLDFAQLFDVAISAMPNDDDFAAQAGRARAMLDRLDSLTSYLSSLAAARSLREMRPVSLSKAIERFQTGLASQARAQGIELTVRIPPYEPLFTRPMHEAAIASVLLNFYTNALLSG
jgi:signal transduction histidine kinase